MLDVNTKLGEMMTVFKHYYKTSVFKGFKLTNKFFLVMDMSILTRGL